MCNCGNCQNNSQWNNNCCCGCRKISFCVPRINFNLCGCRRDNCCHNDCKNENRPCENRPCCDHKQEECKCNCGHQNCNNYPSHDKKEMGYFYGNFYFDKNHDDRREDKCQCDKCIQPRNDEFDGQNY